MSKISQCLLISTLLSLATIAYVGDRPGQPSSPFSNYIQQNSLASMSSTCQSGWLASLNYLDLNRLSSALFQFAHQSLHLNQQRVAAIFFINAGFMFLCLFGAITTKVFFVALRDIEYQHMYDRVLNFLLFKVVFLGAILEPKWDEMFLWVSWLAVIGYLRVFAMLCRDRCDHLCESSLNTPRVQLRMLSFLFLIILANVFWFIVCLFSFRSMLFLLTFECFTLFLDTFQTLIKYLIHLKDLSSLEPWEDKDVYLKKTEFFTDASILVITLVHYVQIALLHGISFTLIDAVLFLNIRSVFKSLRRKYSLYRSYLTSLEHMKARFPDATQLDLENFGSTCAICLDDMKVAQKLPCSHIYHGRCLRLWLETHESCPTCRKGLKQLEECEDSSLLRPNQNQAHHTPLVSPTGSPSSSGVDWDRGLGVVNSLHY